MTTPIQYVPLQAVQYPPEADQDGDDLSRQSLIKDHQSPSNSHHDVTAKGDADGSVEEGDEDVVCRLETAHIGNILTSNINSR